jgi:hypothetical protein
LAAVPVRARKARHSIEGRHLSRGRRRGAKTSGVLAMPGPSFTERYVIVRDSNVLGVDFARRPDPPAPRFPGAGALRPATMDHGEPQARSASSPLAGRVGWGWLECSIVLPAPPCPSPASGKGVAPDLVLPPERGWARPQSDFDGLAIYLRPVRHGQERRKRPCGLPCFRSRSSSPSA